MAKVNFDFKKQCYNLKIQENQLNFVPSGDRGDLVSNINETINQISNQSNFLRTHREACTRENVETLKSACSEVVSQTASSHQVPDNTKKRAKDTQNMVMQLKAA